MMQTGLLEYFFRVVVEQGCCPRDLEVAIVGSTGEGDDVADVLHACDEENETFEAESKTTVRATAEAARVKIPVHLLGFDTEAPHAFYKFVIVGLTDGAADDFANLWKEDISALHSFSIFIEFHVECLDFLGIVSHDDRLLEVFFNEVALVFGGQIAPPVDGEFKLLALGNSFFEQTNPFCIGEAYEIGRNNGIETFEQCGIDHFVEKLQVVLTVIQSPAYTVFDKIFLKVHQIS